MTAIREILLGNDQALLSSTMAALKECSYFRTMREDVLKAVLRSGTYLEVPKGELVIREGAEDDDIYFLIEGTVGVYSDGKPVLSTSDATSSSRDGDGGTSLRAVRKQLADAREQLRAF